MKQTGRVIRRLLLCVLLMLLLSAAGAFADNSLEVWVSPTGIKTVDAIKLLEIQGQACLFLPGKADLSQYKIGFKAKKLLINGEEIQSGTTAEILTAEGITCTVYEGGYAKKLPLTVMYGSDLPSLYITTRTGNLTRIHWKKTYKEKGRMILQDEDGNVVCEGRLQHMKMRGNASIYYAKKNYAIKLEEGANLLGMGKAKKWILLGNHLDKSLIRNQITFDMARYAGLDYTPECRQVSLYVNNEYLGMYLLTEKIEIDDDRIAIRDLEKETEALNGKTLDAYPTAGTRYINRGRYRGKKIPKDPEDISGGYLLEFEHLATAYSTTPSAYYTKHGMLLLVHEPEYCSDAQMKYITGLMQGFENAVFSKDGRDPETGKHYGEFVDFDSLVNKYLINEVSKNYDANMSSEYFYKPQDALSTKVYAGPVWDLDNTYGDYARSGNPDFLKPTGLFAAKQTGQDYWWPALYQQPDFYAAAVKRYHETFVPAMEILLGLREESETLKSLDTYAAAVEKSVAMEYVLYPTLHWKQGLVQTGKDLGENIAYLKDYIAKRMEYLSGIWVKDGE